MTRVLEGNDIVTGVLKDDNNVTKVLEGKDTVTGVLEDDNIVTRGL